MLFNTWFGQMRPAPVSKPEDRYHSVLEVVDEMVKRHGVADITVAGFYYRPKRPIGQIQLRNLAPPGEQKRYNVLYTADERGNMDVQASEHIRDFVLLGYPLYNGVFMEPVQRPDAPSSVCPRHHFLLWPDDAEYNRRILSALSQRGRENG